MLHTLYTTYIKGILGKCGKTTLKGYLENVGKLLQILPCPFFFLSNEAHAALVAMSKANFFSLFLKSVLASL